MIGYFTGTDVTLNHVVPRPEVYQGKFAPLQLASILLDNTLP